MHILIKVFRKNNKGGIVPSPLISSNFGDFIIFIHEYLGLAKKGKENVVFLKVLV